MVDCRVKGSAHVHLHAVLMIHMGILRCEVLRGDESAMFCSNTLFVGQTRFSLLCPPRMRVHVKLCEVLHRLCLSILKCVSSVRAVEPAVGMGSTKSTVLLSNWYHEVLQQVSDKTVHSGTAFARTRAVKQPLESESSKPALSTKAPSSK